MNSLHESADFRFRNALGLNGAMQVHGDLGWPQQPASFPIELIRSANAHRDDGSADLVRHHECTLLKRAHPSIQRPRPLGKDDDADAIGQM